MLLQLLYTLSGKNFIFLSVLLTVLAAACLALIFKSGVRIGVFGNLMSCLAGIVSPLAAALAVRTGNFGLVFSFRFAIETALVILAAAGMIKSGKKRLPGIVIILGNYLFSGVAGSLIPLGMQNPGYWVKTALAVGAFGLFLLFSGSNGPAGDDSKSPVIIPVCGSLEKSLYGNDYDNDGFTAYDRGTGRSFHYFLGEWYDQDGNMIPSASAHAWGLDDYYYKNIAGHDLTGHMPYDSK